MKQLKQKDILLLKERWHNEQNQICPILKQEIPLEKMVIDHQHKLKSEKPDETGKGLCRGAIQFQANVLEGKISNAYKRTGVHKYITLPEFLRNLADYLDHNKIHEEKLIHPSEAPKKPKLMKRSYNELKKVCDKTLPKYTGNYTKPLQSLFESYKIVPEFY